MLLMLSKSETTHADPSHDNIDVTHAGGEPELGNVRLCGAASRGRKNPPELRVQLIEHKPTPASQTTPGQPVPEVIVYVNRADRD